MSTYRRDTVQIRDEELFKQALAEVCKEKGLEYEHDPEGKIRLIYSGGLAHYRITAAQLKSWDDLAWRKEPDGSFTMLLSAHARGEHNQVARDVVARYSEKFLTQKISRHPQLRRYRKRVRRNERGQVVQIRLEA